MITKGTVVAQLVERPIESQAQCRHEFESTVRGGIFFTESTFSADSRGVRTVHVCSCMLQENPNTVP